MKTGSLLQISGGSNDAAQQSTHPPILFKC
jgi:hypothetical protein